MLTVRVPCFVWVKYIDLVSLVVAARTCQTQARLQTLDLIGSNRNGVVRAALALRAPGFYVASCLQEIAVELGLHHASWCSIVALSRSAATVSARPRLAVGIGCRQRHGCRVVLATLHPLPGVGVLQRHTMPGNGRGLDPQLLRRARAEPFDRTGCASLMRDATRSSPSICRGRYIYIYAIISMNAE